MNPLLFCAIGIVRAWTRFYTWHMEPGCGEDRRAEIDSDLWDFHEDARRRGDPPAVITAHTLARLLFGMPHDLLWRIEYEAQSPRRSAWMTAAAIGAAVSIGALWAFFAMMSLGALPPLPDSHQVERVYQQRVVRDR